MVMAYTTFRYIMCVGLDCGKLEFYTWSSEQLHWQKCCTLPEKYLLLLFNLYILFIIRIYLIYKFLNTHISYNHSSTVKRIRWRPISEAIKKDYESERENYPLQIGCCSTDHSVRIFTIPYNNFS